MNKNIKTQSKKMIWQATSTNGWHSRKVGLRNAAGCSPFGQEAVLQVNDCLTNQIVWWNKVIVLDPHNQIFVQWKCGRQLKCPAVDTVNSRTYRHFSLHSHLNNMLAWCPLNHFSWKTRRSGRQVLAVPRTLQTCWCRFCHVCVCGGGGEKKQIRTVTAQMTHIKRTC